MKVTRFLPVRAKLHSPGCTPEQRRLFHDYFVTHLPSSSLHPDRSPHQPGEGQRSPSALPSVGASVGPSRETTVVRIPLKSAKHHFGGVTVRGSRPYNEDTYQAGCIEVPAFAKRQPLSISRRQAGQFDPNKQGQSASGDPQVFYFGVFDGHGGEECSIFLRDRLHGYVEDAAEKFGMKSSIQTQDNIVGSQDAIDNDRVKRGVELQRWVVNSWKELVGGYFKRFRPEYFTALQKGGSAAQTPAEGEGPSDPLSMEAMLTFAFLNADLDFTRAQAQKTTNAPTSEIPVLDDRPINETDVLSHPQRPASQNLTTMLTAPIGGSKRFKGGSTGSIAMVSTPTPMPFWNPASPSTVVVAHVGDTRILLCKSSDGVAVPLTANHHPSTPVEATRLRRYAASFVTDSFGEERMQGLANTRSFGDISSKRLGVSAEPQITTVQLSPGEFSFMVLMSDGVSAVLSDQETVDIVKEARTPEQACKDVVAFATEVSEDADNATCLVVRLGGWERRSEGGGGSLGTKEMRDFKKRDAENPRSRRQ
ncbi:phosphatase 2C-like domain-containing protein [Elsinoe ampelina]|uniref:Phosphatase 2C-like domain-containing protein n=1 Tax=Elsinoe ampelina TaxID=302913 RepID=A0A6A6FYA3_9PEZI|nr:phosphatase 2C-like domain-containing protein [Elsinoe ampelina]